MIEPNITKHYPLTGLHFCIVVAFCFGTSFCFAGQICGCFWSSFGCSGGSLSYCRGQPVALAFRIVVVDLRLPWLAGCFEIDFSFLFGCLDIWLAVALLRNSRRTPALRGSCFGGSVALGYFRIVVWKSPLIKLSFSPLHFVCRIVVLSSSTSWPRLRSACSVALVAHILFWTAALLACSLRTMYTFNQLYELLLRSHSRADLTSRHSIVRFAFASSQSPNSYCRTKQGAIAFGSAKGLVVSQQVAPSSSG